MSEDALAKAMKWVAVFRTEPPLRLMPYQEWMVAMADEIARLEAQKSTFAHNAAMLGAKNADLRRILREINDRWQAHNHDIGDLLETGLSG